MKFNYRYAVNMEKMGNERCALCGCRVHREGNYASPDTKGRSHATEHHYVAERFYGRSKNRPKENREPIIGIENYDAEGKTNVYCYECHEELIHNPILLPEDIAKLNKIFIENGLTEEIKTESRSKHAKRIKIFHDVIRKGIDVILNGEDQ